MNVKELMDLSGRVAVVTGGYGIYGAPISEGLAEGGAHVVIASRSAEKCEAEAARLRGKGLKASAATYDQGDDSSILRLRDQLLKEFGEVPILVNNSVGRAMRGFKDTAESWRKSMDVNANGLFVISRAFLESMMEKKRGSMINISSIQGVVAPAFDNYTGTNMTTSPDYHFHKHGMIGLTKYMAAYAGPHGVRVNAISPGGFQQENHKDPFLSNYNRRVFLGRMARHDDIKGAVVFLASDASGYITGHNLLLDGGYTPSRSMLISPHLALVGDRQFGLSDPYDCHVYAVRAPQGVVLIDAGSGRGEEAIAQRLEWCFPGVPVKTLLLTHAHADHFAGAAGLRRRFGCAVVAPKLTRAVVETGDEEACGLRRARAVGGYPPELRLAPCPVNSVYGDGDRLELAGQSFQVIAVQGHSEDSSCLLTEIDGRRTLFSADVLHYGGVLGLINSRDSTMQGYHRDLPRLAGLQVEALFSGHGLFTLARGQEHIDKAIELSRGGFVPRVIAQGDAIF